MINLFKKKEKYPKNFEDLLKEYKKLNEKIVTLNKELYSLKERSKFSIQKIKVKRYNPFSGVGGNQSFSVALLDNNNDGVVITSLYTRDGNRVYAKPLKGGDSEYQLSEEEKEIVKQAKNI